MRRLLIIPFALGLLIQSRAETLRVVATTSLVGDVVRAVGGPAIDLAVLVSAGQDPHTFEPAPRDAARLANAQLVFINGAGLETFLDPLLETLATAGGQLVDLSEGLPLLGCGETRHEHSHARGEHDPHVWFDPRLVARWTVAIEGALAGADPTNAGSYRARAESYRQHLADLDQWIEARVAEVSPEQRRLVSDHEELAYFAHRYGFTLTGALAPGATSATESSARQLAELERRMRETDTHVVVVGAGANPALARRVAGDTGAQVVTLYTAGLSPPSGPAATYLDFMRHNVSVLCQALRAEAP